MRGLREVAPRTGIIHRMHPERVGLELGQAGHMGAVQLTQLEQQFAPCQDLSDELEPTLVEHRQVELEFDRQCLVEVHLGTELLDEVAAHDFDERGLLRLRTLRAAWGLGALHQGGFTWFWVEFA